jgi:hypothetical protein
MHVSPFAHVILVNKKSSYSVCRKIFAVPNNQAHVKHDKIMKFDSMRLQARYLTLKFVIIVVINYSSILNKLRNVFITPQIVS